MCSYCVFVLVTSIIRSPPPLKAVLGLRNISKPTALRFLPIILNELFRIMVVGRPESSRAAMISVFHVLVAYGTTHAATHYSHLALHTRTMRNVSAPYTSK